MHAAIGSWTVTLHVALRPSLCAIVVFFCVAETSDIKAYLTFSKTIQGRFGCFKNQGFVKASLEFKTVAGTPSKMRFHERRVEKETWTWMHCYFSTILKYVTSVGGLAKRRIVPTNFFGGIVTANKLISCQLYYDFWWTICQLYNFIVHLCSRSHSKLFFTRW